MPRTAADEDNQADRPKRKRASVRRTPRKVAAKTVRKKATRRRAVRGSSPKPEAQPEVTKVPKPEIKKTVAKPGERKAPTAIAARKASTSARRKQMVVIGVIVTVGVTASAVVGFTDSGQIDVRERIEERNERIRSGQSDEGESQRIVVPVQDTKQNELPNGGFTPVSQSDLAAFVPAATPPAVPATTSPTSTAATATTSDATAAPSATSTDSEDISDDSISTSTATSS